MVEGILFVYVAYLRSPYERYDLRQGTFVLRPGRYTGWPSEVFVNSHGFIGGEFEPRRNADDLRIVALGDSCTVGPGDRTGHYPARLEWSLRRREVARQVQVINAGLDGLTSAQALGRLRGAVLPLEPDVITILIGWNDLMKQGPGGQASDAGAAIVLRYLDRFWTIRGLRKLVFYHLRGRYGSPPLTGPASRSGRFERYTPEPFERNLHTIVSEARDAGARPLLLTLPSPVQEHLSSLEVRSRNLQFPYFLGAAAVGDFADLIAAYNRSIRRVAITEQIDLVDVARRWRRMGNDGSLFLDSMHLTPRGHARLARLLEQELVERGMLTPSRKEHG